MSRIGVLELLKKQGRANLIDDVLVCFREEQLELMVEHKIDLIDMDRWKSLEVLIGLKLNRVEAFDIINKFWEYDIEVMDLPYKANGVV